MKAFVLRLCQVSVVLMSIGMLVSPYEQALAVGAPPIIGQPTDPNDINGFLDRSHIRYNGDTFTDDKIDDNYTYVDNSDSDGCPDKMDHLTNNNSQATVHVMKKDNATGKCDETSKDNIDLSHSERAQYPFDIIDANHIQTSDGKTTYTLNTNDGLFYEDGGDHCKDTIKITTKAGSSDHATIQVIARTGGDNTSYDDWDDPSFSGNVVDDKDDCNIFSPVSFKAYALPLPSDSSGNSTAGGATELQPTCAVGSSLAWLVCPIISALQSAITTMEGWMKTVLTVTPLDSSGPIYQAWAAFRNLADVFFILIFFIVIFGTSLGLDNYTVKKMLPRLIAASILVQFSFLLVGLAVDVSNVLGQGLSALIGSVGVAGSGAGNSDSMKIFGGIEGLVAIGAIGGYAFATGALIPVLLAVASGALSIIAAFITLEVRLLLINFLIVIAPLAFVLWVLPNTEKYFKIWWDYLSKLLLMFPIIMVILATANLFSVVSANSDDNVLQKVIASIVPILAFVMIPATFKLAGKAISFGHSMATRATNGAHGGLSNKIWSKDKQEARRDRGLAKADKLRRLGKGNTLKGRLARSQAGFGLSTPTGPKANRMESAMERSFNERAQAKALANDRAMNPMESYDKRLKLRTEALTDKMMETRAGEMGNLSSHTFGADVTVGNVIYKKGQTLELDGRLGNVDLNPDNVKNLTGIVRDAMASGDYATAVAGMRSLGRSTGGQDALYAMKSEVFGGGDKQTATPGTIKSIWDLGTANVDGKAAPHLKGPDDTALGNMNGEKFVGLNKGGKAAYVTYAATHGPEKAAEFERVLAEVQNNSRLNSRMGSQDYERMHDALQAAPSGGASISPATHASIQQGAGRGSEEMHSAQQATPSDYTEPLSFDPQEQAAFRQRAAQASATRTAPTTGTPIPAPTPQTLPGTPAPTSPSTTSNVTNNTTSTTTNTNYAAPSAGRTTPDASSRLGGGQAAPAPAPGAPARTFTVAPNAAPVQRVEATIRPGDLDTLAREIRRAGTVQPPSGGMNPPQTPPPPPNPSLVDPQSEGQDDEPGDDRSIS